MKYVLLVFLAVFLISCQNPTLGCAEGEQLIDGECVATSSGYDLFGNDFSTSVKSEEVEGEVRGFLAEPLEEGSYPGVLMVHEWWGLNDNIREMAKILASEGYIVFAIDLYNGSVATTSDEARVLAGSVRGNQDEAIMHMQRALLFLEEKQATKVASLGWCFGGGESLLVSLNSDVDATVIYYGSLVQNESQLQNLNSVLGIFGEEDQSIPVDSVREFGVSLTDLGVENEIYIYPNVGHAFANPSGNNYAPNETIDAWNKTVEYLDRKLKS